MRCDEITPLLPALVDGEPMHSEVDQHIETCLRCQAELARYRRLLRTLSLLRSRYAEPTPGLLGETLAAITDAAETGAASHVALRSSPRLRGCDRRRRTRRDRDGRSVDRALASPLGTQPRRLDSAAADASSAIQAPLMLGVRDSPAAGCALDAGRRIAAASLPRRDAGPCTTAMSRSSASHSGDHKRMAA